MIGVPVILGTDRSPCDVAMQIEGQAQVISADVLRRVIDESATLLRVLLRYAHGGGELHGAGQCSWEDRGTLSTLVADGTGSDRWREAISDA
jgi:hypothetical protein